LVFEILDLKVADKQTNTPTNRIPPRLTIRVR